MPIKASPSFFGVGVPPDVPDWGGMMKRAAEVHLKSAPRVAMSPAMAIFVVVFGFILLGDALRDVWDPKLRGARPSSTPAGARPQTMLSFDVDFSLQM